MVALIAGAVALLTPTSEPASDPFAGPVAMRVRAIRDISLEKLDKKAIMSLLRDPNLDVRLAMAHRVTETRDGLQRAVEELKDSNLPLEQLRAKIEALHSRVNLARQLSDAGCFVDNVERIVRQFVDPDDVVVEQLIAEAARNHYVCEPDELADDDEEEEPSFGRCGMGVAASDLDLAVSGRPEVAVRMMFQEPYCRMPGFLKAVGNTGDPRAEGPVIQFSCSENAEMRAAALEALTDLAGPAAMRRLAEMRFDRDPHIRNDAMWSFKETGRLRYESVRIGLRDRFASLRVSVLWMLYEDTSADALAVLREARRDSSPKVRATALALIADFDDPISLPILIGVDDRASEEELFAVIDALGGNRLSRARTRLAQLMRHSNPEVAKAARKAFQSEGGV